MLAAVQRQSELLLAVVQLPAPEVSFKYISPLIHEAGGSAVSAGMATRTQAPAPRGRQSEYLPAQEGANHTPTQTAITSVQIARVVFDMLSASLSSPPYTMQGQGLASRALLVLPWMWRWPCQRRRTPPTRVVVVVGMGVREVVVDEVVVVVGGPEVDVVLVVVVVVAPAGKVAPMPANQIETWERLGSVVVVVEVVEVVELEVVVGGVVVEVADTLVMAS